MTDTKTEALELLSRELLQQALDALNTCDWDYDYDEESYKTFDENLVNSAAAAIEAELAKPEQNTHCKYCGGIGCVVCDGRCLPKPKHPLDKKAENARELGLDYEPLGNETDNASDIGRGDMYKRHFGYTEYGLRGDENGKLSIGEIPRKEWVGLTELEQRNIFKDIDWENEDWACLAYARAIEAALREKNT